jgi:hydrogenase maturation protease
VVIGVGNPYRHDDGVGPAVVALLRGRLAGVEFVTCDGDPGAMIDTLSDAGHAVIVDAVRSADNTAGHIYRFDTAHPAATRAGIAASHAADLGDTLALVRELGRLPDSLAIYTVQVDDVSFGVGLSPAVLAAAGRLVDEIVARLAGAATTAGTFVPSRTGQPVLRPDTGPRHDDG